MKQKKISRYNKVYRKLTKTKQFQVFSKKGNDKTKFTFWLENLPF